MDSDDIFDNAERHWPAMVNRDRTYLHMIVMPKSEFERRRNAEAKEALDALKSSGYPMQSVTFEPEPVGEIYLMAYDPIRDKLYVWEAAE